MDSWRNSPARVNIWALKNSHRFIAYERACPFKPKAVYNILSCLRSLFTSGTTILPVLLTAVAWRRQRLESMLFCLWSLLCGRNLVAYFHFLRIFGFLMKAWHYIENNYQEIAIVNELSLLVVIIFACTFRITCTNEFFLPTVRTRC